ncbi:MAG: Aminotran 5 protein [Dehalococcoidia bacterium]|nr:Aminotran 5 protein [Dehalococcoidia bacterium]
MDINKARLEIPATQKTIYLNHGWSGPSPRRVVEAIKERLEYENDEGPTSPHVQESRRGIKSEARGAFARFIGAAPEEIVLTDNTTDGINIILNGLPWREGDELVTTSLEHGSGLVPSYYLRRREGVKVTIVELDAGDDTSTVLSKFEAAMGPRTRLLLVSHVMYRNGLRLPLKELQEMAHRHGAMVLVDAAQSMGHLALNMPALGCDFYAMPAHKWLLGPDGVGALYIRRELIPQVEPSKMAGGAATSYDTTGNFEPRVDEVRKYELTTSSTPLLAGAAAAVEFLEEAGMAAVEARILELSARLRRSLLPVPGLTLTSPLGGELASGLVSFALSGQEPRSLVEALWNRYKIVARSVNEPPGVRFSVHFFNTEEELDKTAQAVKDLAKAGTATTVH